MYKYKTITIQLHCIINYTTVQITTIITIQIYNYRATQLHNYIKWKTIKLQYAILEALYIREIKPGLNKQDELRDHKLIIKI